MGGPSSGNIWYRIYAMKYKIVLHLCLHLLLWLQDIGLYSYIGDISNCVQFGYMDWIFLLISFLVSQVQFFFFF